MSLFPTDMAPTVDTQIIPITDLILLKHEGHAKNLLPQQQRSPTPMDVIATDDIALAGLQDVDGEKGEPNMRVLVAGQKDARQNGPYAMQAAAWRRISAPSPGSNDGDPKGPLLAFRASYRVNRGLHGQAYYWITSLDPIMLGVSTIEIDYMGRNLFDPAFVEAERQIFIDLVDKNHQPLMPSSLAAPQQLTNAKAYKTMAILYQQAITGGVAGSDPDRHERMAKHWNGRYEQERGSLQLRLIDGARQLPRRRRVIRG